MGWQLYSAVRQKNSVKNRISKTSYTQGTSCFFRFWLKTNPRKWTAETVMQIHSSADGTSQLATYVARLATSSLASQAFLVPRFSRGRLAVSPEEFACLSIPGRGDSHMKGVGVLDGNLETNLWVAKPFLTLEQIPFYKLWLHKPSK